MAVGEIGCDTAETGGQGVGSRPAGLAAKRDGLNTCDGRRAETGDVEKADTGDLKPPPTFVVELTGVLGEAIDTDVAASLTPWSVGEETTL